jgi:hypothetical protein
VKITGELKQPQRLTPTLASEKLNTLFAVPTSASLALRTDARLDLHVVRARLTCTLHDCSIPPVAVSSLREYSGTTFQLAVVGSWSARPAHISVDDEFSHPV